MNIFYCHGLQSTFDPQKEKIKTLSTLGPVSGDDINYIRDPESTISGMVSHPEFTDVDLIVGTSMGGWLASQIGARYGIPFVAINPALNPAESLRRHIGTSIPYKGRGYVLDAEAVSRYWPLATNGCGLILLDDGDEVFNAKLTASTLSPHYSVHTFEGGNHRFEHMTESLSLIKLHHQNCEMVYGFGSND